jgi:hypothetical protein
MEKKKKRTKKSMKKKGGSGDVLNVTAAAVAMWLRKKGSWL